ncbi:MAG: ATP-binding protein [Polyangiaceae bacterium]
MRLITSFQTRAMAGTVAVTMLLAGGMALTTHHLTAASGEQVARIQEGELEITLAERLRWSGELIVSAGRGVLLSGDPAQRAKLHEALAEFDQDILALNRDAALGRRGTTLIAEVARAANEFRRVQTELVIAREQGDRDRGLIRRFETELVPLQHELRRSLDRLVDDKEVALKDVYSQAETDRVRLTDRMHGLLAALVLSAFGISWYFASRLARAYRTEQVALGVARKALGARDELMGVVAHDLRNPLGAIMMRAALLRLETDPEETRQHAESIENIALRMEYLIKSMLDVTTMEAGRFSVTLAPCRVEDLLRDTTEIFGTLSGSKQIELRETVKELGLVIRADRERILEILSNLLGNAFKFAPRGGEVTISVERQLGMVRFAISDTGPGISSEHLPHVFDRFWKSETSGKKGTGLGLFIAKGIVDAHGGRIWIESEPGHGATCYFTIPIAETLPLAAPQRTAVFPTERELADPRVVGVSAAEMSNGGSARN